MREQHRSTRPTGRSAARVIARLAMMAVAGLLVAAPGAPAGADHVPTDIGVAVYADYGLPTSRAP